MKLDPSVNIALKEIERRVEQRTFHGEEPSRFKVQFKMPTWNVFDYVSCRKKHFEANSGRIPTIANQTCNTDIPASCDVKMSPSCRAWQFQSKRPSAAARTRECLLVNWFAFMIVAVFVLMVLSSWQRSICRSHSCFTEVARTEVSRAGNVYASSGVQRRTAVRSPGPTKPLRNASLFSFANLPSSFSDSSAEQGALPSKRLLGLREGCTPAHILSLQGSGIPMCYQGHQGGSYEMDGPIPGDGACASCTTSADDAACLSCFEGFQLEAADPGSCTGRCVPEQAARPVAAGCAHRADQKCGVAPSTALCHDLHPSCGWRAALDPGFCNQSSSRACRSTCGVCSPTGPDPGLEPLLLRWRSGLSLGPGSPLAWGWGGPVRRWPGVELSGASLGGFLSALHLEDFGFRGPLEPGWAHLAQPLGRMSWDLSHNRATGTLPPEWSAVLPRLSSLDLSRNALRGTLPAAWALASAAAPAGGLAINLGLNSLSGALPPAWLARGRLRSVTDLNLEGNRLTGTIPADWSALGSRLWALSLAGNRVAGTLPRELSAFAGARVL